jgi:hypothetical protein
LPGSRETNFNADLETKRKDFEKRLQSLEVKNKWASYANSQTLSLNENKVLDSLNEFLQNQQS